jgi:3-phenylpropionate/cinnamic acid dioxygenase small subunit
MGLELKSLDSKKFRDYPNLYQTTIKYKLRTIKTRFLQGN